MEREMHVLRLLLCILPLCLRFQFASAQSGGWCQTGVVLLPNLTALLSSSSYQYYGAADDECSSFYLTAIDSEPSAPSPSVLLKADETLTVTLVNQHPIPSSLLASGFRYVTGMEYFNLRLFAAITTTLPLSAPTAAAASTGPTRHRLRASSSSSSSSSSSWSSSNVSSGLAVLSPSNLTLLEWYPLSRSVALQDVAIDYSDSTLYATASLSVSALLHFSIAADGRLSPLPDVPLVSQPAFSAILGSALLYPGGLLLYVSGQTTERGQWPAGDSTGNVTGAVWQYDVKGAVWSSLLNASTALPVTSMADLWSTSQPNFGSLHVIDATSLYNYDTC